jgi:putative endonuclease
MISVYVLKSLKDDTLYIGMTNDLPRRILEHNRGKNRSTKHKAPFTLILEERYPDYSEARKREKSLKSGSNREHLRQIARVV